VPEQGLLANLPVGRRDDESGVRTRLLRVAGELDGLARAARTDPDHERHPAADDPHDLFGEALALLGGQVRGLAGAPKGEMPLTPASMKRSTTAFRGLEIQLSPFVEGRDHRWHKTVEHTPTSRSPSSLPTL
jgi:hypothetical protein